MNFDVDSLKALDRTALLKRYQSLYEQAAPIRISLPMLQAAVAYRIQEDQLGALKPAVRRALLAESKGQTAVGTGTVLIREWHGKHYTVRIHDDGVEFRGERYKSLSVVARLITGQQRSGPTFFGLKHGE